MKYHCSKCGSDKGLIVKLVTMEVEGLIPNSDNGLDVRVNALVPPPLLSMMCSNCGYKPGREGLEKALRESLTLTVDRDDIGYDPREEPNLGTMACFHKRRSIGDDHSMLIETAHEIEDDTENYFSLPIYCYEHSDITIATSPFACRFDSGQVGIIYIGKGDAKKELFNYSSINGEDLTPEELEKKVYEILEAEVLYYDNYLQGNCYWYCLQDLNGDVLTSCGGFTQYDLENKQDRSEEYCRKEGEAAREAFIKQTLDKLRN